MGLLKFVARRTFEFVLIILLLVYLPKIPPNAKISEPYNVTPALPFEGPLNLNEKLNDVEIWHKGDFLGPEAFADYKGELYTTLHGGDVVKLTGNHITPVVKFGKPCKGYYQERLCGRPLGLTFDKSGMLYVADAYYGLFKVDITTGKKERLVAVDDVIDGRNVTLPNSVTVASSGDIFWTDSSTEFRLEDGIFDMLADGSGRLIHYDPKTKKNKVLISNLHFANGVALSENEEFVLVSETARNRLHRYYLKGSKKGTHDIFIDGLPGMTDNLKSDGKGGFIVPLVIAVDIDHPGFTQIFGPFPLARKFFARLLGITEFTFKFINEIYPNELAERGIHTIGHFTTFQFANPKRVTILHISKDGKILDSIHNLNKKIEGISEAHVFKDTLYLGSPFNDYIARIPLSKIGWEHLKEASAPKLSPTTPKPTTTTTQKPTTTTPKPKPKPATTTPKPTTTTPKPTTTPPKPTTSTPKPSSAPKPTIATPKSTTTTPKPITTTPKPTTTIPKATQSPTTMPPKPTQAPTPQSAQAQPVKDQPKSLPVKEPSKTKN